MKIYTRMGDGGETSLPGGRRLSKADAIFELLGDLDETNAAIGLATSHLPSGSFPIKELLEVQSTLLSIGACIASENPPTAKLLKVIDKLTDKHETQIDEWDKQLPTLKNFILPEGTQAAAALHLCRTLIRRAERSYHLTDQPAALTPIARYINRLSDYFFQAARFANFQAGHRENIWQQ